VADAVATIEGDSVLVAEKVKEALDACKGEAEPALSACLMLEKWANEDSRLHYALTRRYLHEACYKAVSSLVRTSRNVVWTTTKSVRTPQNGHRVAALSRSLMDDFRLPGGKPLRLATKVDLAEAADLYRKQAKDMVYKALWLDRIAIKVGDKTVGEVFEDAQLEALQHEVLGGKK
jgi:hypothetical protein